MNPSAYRLDAGQPCRPRLEFDQINRIVMATLNLMFSSAVSCPWAPQRSVPTGTLEPTISASLLARSMRPAPAAWSSRAVLTDEFVEVMGDLLEWLGRARGAGKNDGTFD